jgi:hypothetical protein
MRSDVFGRLLLPIDCDCGIGTDERAINASRAIILNQDSKAVALQVNLLGQTETLLGTGCYAQLATLTDLFGEYDFATDHRDLSLSLFDVEH